MHEAKLVKSIRQLYDESGRAYYPLSASGAIMGDLSSLNLGNIKKVIDLSYCLSLNFVGGLFTVSIVNNMFFFYEVNCSYGSSGGSIPVDEDLIIANNIPDSYRINGAIIPLSADDGMTDSLSVYVDENGAMRAKVLPLGRTDVGEDKYKSSITTIKATGFFAKYQANNSNEKDKYKSSVDFLLSEPFAEETTLTFNVRADREYKIEAINNVGYVISANFFEPDNRIVSASIKVPVQATMVRISGDFKVIRYPNSPNITAINVGNMNDLIEFTYIDYTVGKQIPSLKEFSMGINSIKDMSAMFYDCSALESVTSIYTNNTTTMYQMFYNCNSLVNIPSTLTTDNVDNMKEMFYGCSSLIRAPYMNTSLVTNMSYMFAYNYKLSFVPTYDCKSCQNMSYMFYGCNTITELGSFNTSKCTNFERSFQNCTSLVSVEYINMESSTTMYGIIDGCNHIESINIDRLRLEYDFKPNTMINAESIDYMLDNISDPVTTDLIIDITGVAGSPEIYTGDWNVLQAIARGWNIIGANSPTITFGMNRLTTTHTIAFNGASDAPYTVEAINSLGVVLSSITCDASILPITNGLDLPSGTEKVIVRGSMIIFQYPIDIVIKTIDVENMPMLANLSTMGSDMGKYDPCKQSTTLTRFTLRQNNMTNMSYMFDGCNTLTSIPEMDTSNTIYMEYMFRNCAGLGSIPIIDTSKVTNTSHMFDGCTSLTTIPQINLAEAMDTSYMFDGCTSITALPALNIITSATVEAMFSRCINLKTIGGISTSVKLLNTEKMFYNCNELTSIPMIDMSKVVDASYMFYNCKKIAEIPQLVMSFVNSTEYMFYGCSLLKKTPPLDIQRAVSTKDMFNSCSVLSSIGKLQTGNVEDMSNMFRMCSSLITIPSLDVSKVTNMSYMFYNCVKLVSIPSTLDIRKVTNMEYMFAYCSSLSNIPLNLTYTGSVTNMSYMFLNCAGITSIDDGMENAKCTNFSGMFKGCSNASGIFTIKNLNSTAVTDIFTYTTKKIVFRFYSTNTAALSYMAPSNVTKQVMA